MASARIRRHCARPLQRRRRHQARAQTRPRPLLQYIRAFGFGSAFRRRAARRNARPAAARQVLAAGFHRLRRHRPGSGRHAAATGHHGLHHRQWRRLSAAAHPHARPAVHDPANGRPTSSARRRSCSSLFRARRGSAQSTPAGAHRVISDARRRPDAQDDGRRRPLRHRQDRAARRLLLRGKTGTAQKIDPVTHTLFEDHAHRLVRRLRASQQSGHRRGCRSSIRRRAHYYGTAVSAPVFAEVAQQVLEYLGVPHDIDLRPSTTASKKDPPVTEDDAPAQRRRYSGALRRRQRSAQRRSAPRFDRQSDFASQPAHRRRPRILQPPKAGAPSQPSPSAASRIASRIRSIVTREHRRHRRRRKTARAIADRPAGPRGHRASRVAPAFKSRSPATASRASRPPPPAPWSLPAPKSSSGCAP